MGSVVTQRCWSPIKIRRTKLSQNSYGNSYYAFPPKNARREEGEQMKLSTRYVQTCCCCCSHINSQNQVRGQTELTWPRVSTQLLHGVPRSHNYPTRGYKLQRLGCLHRTNRTVTVSTDERACCLKCCCQSDDPRACSKKLSNRTQNHHTNTRGRPVFPGYLTDCSAATTPLPENLKLRRVVPHEGYTTPLVPTLQNSVTKETCCTTAANKKTEKRRSLLS